MAGHSEDSHSQSQDNADLTAYPQFMDQRLMQQLVNNTRAIGTLLFGLSTLS